MARILASTPPAAGHLFPLVPGLLELQRRGHEVHLRVGEKLLATTRAAGLDASPADPALAAIEVDDFAPGKATDKLRKGIHQPARARPPRARRHASARSPSATPTCSSSTRSSTGGRRRRRRRPPVGDHAAVAAAAPRQGHPALRPRASRRCAAARPRARLPPLAASSSALYATLDAAEAQRAASRRRAARAALADRPRARAPTASSAHRRPVGVPAHDAHEKVRFVGAPAVGPAGRSRDLAWLDEPGDPWVLVTCSTDYQADERLALAAVEALRHEPVRVLARRSPTPTTTSSSAGAERARRALRRRTRRCSSAPPRSSATAAWASSQKAIAGRRADRRRAVRARSARGRAARASRPERACSSPPGSSRRSACAPRCARSSPCAPAPRPRALACAPRGGGARFADAAEELVPNGVVAAAA